MQAQTYENHTRWVIGFHFISSAAILALLVGSVVNLIRSLQNHHNLFSAALICLVAVIFCLLYLYIRYFPLKVQDRAIRAEENLRHYVLTGKLLDSRLRISQIIALRFASDDELADLSKKAAEEGLNNDAIKREIRKWRPDHHRA